MILNILLAIKMLKKLIFLARLSAFRRDFYKTKWMTFFIKDEKLLEKYNEIWEKVCTIIKKEFVIKLVYNEQYLSYLKTKIKVYNKKINADFHDNKIPKKDS